VALAHHDVTMRSHAGAPGDGIVDEALP